ncbi:MAG: Uma2 family endonuclease [Silvibacterium sp.]|nr:Uma2 family endonuclease [Silvibacterium sp.]MBV8436463.1 Uma2 family endonuclease [Silvibacterium sp.]
MATPAHTFIPVELYLHSSYEPDAEYVDGKIEERPPAELDHSAWQAAILYCFAQHAHEWNIRELPSLRVQVAPTRYRVPDVTVLDRDRPIEQIITQPPIAVFEVLSPEDTMTRMMRKLNDYSAMGIPQIWVIDPKGPRSWRFENGQLNPSSTFGAPGERIHFSISEIERLLD